MFSYMNSHESINQLKKLYNMKKQGKMMIQLRGTERLPNSNDRSKKIHSVNRVSGRNFAH